MRLRRKSCRRLRLQGTSTAVRATATTGKTALRPQRTCVQCGTKGDKNGFLRIAGRKESGWAVDEKAVLPGRGFYLCHVGPCIDRFIRRIATPKGGARWGIEKDGVRLAEALRSAVSVGSKL